MRFSAGEQLINLDDTKLYWKGAGVPEVNADNYCQILNDEFTDAYTEATDINGHRLGGYAYHVQDNPRMQSRFSDYVLLLQLDNDDEHGMMWGDLGVCHFFIHPDDLRRCDFSKVMYDWQCH